MERSEFKERMKQYKKAREENPGLKYWEWKDVPKYDEGGEIKGKSIPTQEEYIAEQIAVKRAAALDKSRNRTSVRVPMVANNETEEKWKSRINDNIRHQEERLSKIMSDYDHYKKKFGISLFQDEQKVLDALLEEKDKGYPKLVSGSNCMYNAGDCYGLNIPGNKTFVAKHKEKGFVKAAKGSMEPGDIVQDVKGGFPIHAMIYDSKDNEGNLLFNYARGSSTGNIEDDYVKQGKYPLPIKDYDVYKYVGTPADSAQWVNDYKKLYGFADGGEVTGPPTYEDWYTNMTTPKLNVFDDAYFHININDAAADLHNIAMTLPGYANKWNEYQRSRPKEDPSIDAFVNDLWANENPNNVGYRNGKYYPHKSPEGGKMTIGPGFKLDSGSHGISTKTANRGMTKTRLNQEARKIGKQHLAAVDQFLNYGLTTNPADTVSPQIKMGLMDLRHLVGPLNEWGNLRQAVLEGDLDRIKKESTVTWNDNGKIKVDKRRKKIRDTKYFHYKDGGEVNNPYSTGRLIDSLYGGMVKEEHLGEPWHKYDFTISEEEAERLGYFKDERGHRDDRVKKEAHPSHPSRGNWKSFYQYDLTDFGMRDPNHTLFGLVDGGQDPQAMLTYKGGIVLPELTVTPKKKYVHNTYDNIHLIY